MITLVWRTDAHLSDKPPQSRKDDWAQTILGKIRQVGRVAKDVAADAVIDGGDLFHIKSPTRNTHRLVRQVADVHTAYPCPTYACVGNHDCKWGDYRYLNEQPLGVLFSTGVIGRLYDDHECHLQGDGSPLIKPGPVIGDEPKFTVRVVGIPYHGSVYDMDRFKIKKGSEDYLIVVAHVLASPEGGSMFEGEDIVKFADLAELDPDIWLLGHWHKDRGIYDIGNGKYAVANGALSRGSIAQDDVKREPSCVVIRLSDKIEFDTRRLEILPPEEVFDLEGRMRAEARSTMMDDFITTIRETLIRTDKETIEESVQKMDIPAEVKERTIFYLEQVD